MRHHNSPRIYTDTTDHHRLSVRIRRIRINPWLLLFQSRVFRFEIRVQNQQSSQKKIGKLMWQLYYQEEISMTKRMTRIITNIFLKLLAVIVMVATQSITFAQEVRRQAQNPPNVDLPFLAGKSMEDIIKEINKPRRCREFKSGDKRYQLEESPSRLPSTIPPVDDYCHFKVGGGRLSVGSYRGRAVVFLYFFGLKAPSEPEEALLRVGINVNGAKPLQRREMAQDYIWAGEFSGRSWTELRVVQIFLKSRKCHEVIAIVSDEVQK